MKLALVVGEPMVELLDGSPGSTGKGFGGDALNVAVYLAREAPELHVALASAAGDDPASDALVSLCHDEHLDVSWLRRVPGTRLGSYRVTVDASGERSFVYDRSLSPFRSVLDRGDLLPDPSEVDIVAFSGIALAVQHDRGRRVLFGFAEAAHAREALVAYDTNHRPALWDIPAEARTWLERIAPIVDVILASADDCRELLGLREASDLAVALRALGASEVVVTDGPRPSTVAFAGRVEEVPVVVPDAVIDTTAAGDAFDAGYLASRSRGADPAAAVAAGHRVAARVVAHRGAIVPLRIP